MNWLVQTSKTHGEYRVINYSTGSLKSEIILSFLSGKTEWTQTSYVVLVSLILVVSVMTGSIVQIYF